LYTDSPEEDALMKQKLDNSRKKIESIKKERKLNKEKKQDKERKK